MSFTKCKGLVSIEGPFDPDFLTTALRRGDISGEPLVPVIGHQGAIACISPRSVRSISFDGRGDLNRPWVGVYLLTYEQIEEPGWRRLLGKEGREEVCDFAGVVSLVDTKHGTFRKIESKQMLSNCQGAILVRRGPVAAIQEPTGVEVIRFQIDADLRRNWPSSESADEVPSTLTDAAARLGPNEVCDEVQDLPLGEVGRALERAGREEDGATFPAPRREPFEVLHVDWIVEESAEADHREWTRRLQEGDHPFKERRYGFAAPDSLIVIRHRVQRVARARQGGNGRFLIALGDMGDDWTISDLRENYGLRVELNERGITCWPGEQYALVGSLVGGKLTFPLEDIDLSKALFAPVAMDKSVAMDRIRWFDSGWRPADG